METRSHNIGTGSHEQEPWFVLFTASNNEKKVERQLHNINIHTFLPLYSVKRKWKIRTTTTIHLPVFPNYVFVQCMRTEITRLLSLPMVYSAVGNKHGALPIPADEIEALRSGIVERGAEPHADVKIGQKVRICAGALTGWQGMVVRVDAGLRVVLAVESIMRSIAVRVTSDEIEPVSEPEKQTLRAGGNPLEAVERV